MKRFNNILKYKYIVISNTVVCQNAPQPAGCVPCDSVCEPRDPETITYVPCRINDLYSCDICWLDVAKWTVKESKQGVLERTRSENK